MATLAPAAPLLAFGPPGWVAYGALGLGSLAVLGAGAVYMANQKADAQTSSGSMADACSNCEFCKNQNNKISDTKNELKQRYQELREDGNELYQYRPGPAPGKGKTTWPGHQQQFQDKQSRLRQLMNDSNAAGCPKTPENSDAWKWAARKTPSQPAPKM